jgi:hypothetical protein
MGVDVVKYTRCDVREVNTVAICGGAGSFLIGDAMRAGADAFITSDVKYHEFFDAQGRCCCATSAITKARNIQLICFLTYCQRNSLNLQPFLQKLSPTLLII